MARVFCAATAYFTVSFVQIVALFSWRSPSSFRHFSTLATPRWWSSPSGSWPARLDSTLPTPSSAGSTRLSRLTESPVRHHPQICGVCWKSVSLALWHRKIGGVIGTMCFQWTHRVAIFGKSRTVGEFGGCQGNVQELTKCQGKQLVGKKLSVAYCKLEIYISVIVGCCHPFKGLVKSFWTFHSDIYIVLVALTKWMLEIEISITTLLWRVGENVWEFHSASSVVALDSIDVKKRCIKFFLMFKNVEKYFSKHFKTWWKRSSCVSVK